MTAYIPSWWEMKNLHSRHTKTVMEVHTRNLSGAVRKKVRAGIVQGFYLGDRGLGAELYRLLVNRAGVPKATVSKHRESYYNEEPYLGITAWRWPDAVNEALKLLCTADETARKVAGKPLAKLEFYVSKYEDHDDYTSGKLYVVGQKTAAMREITACYAETANYKRRIASALQFLDDPTQTISTEVK